MFLGARDEVEDLCGFLHARGDIAFMDLLQRNLLELFFFHARGMYQMIAHKDME